MSHLAFRMMMESGVLRPGDREIRRGPGGVPLHASRQVSDVLNHAVDVLLGSALKSAPEKMTEVIPPPQPDGPTPFRPSSSRFSLKRILLRLGLIEQTNACIMTYCPTQRRFVPWPSLRSSIPQKRRWPRL